MDSTKQKIVVEFLNQLVNRLEDFKSTVDEDYEPFFQRVAVLERIKYLPREVPGLKGTYEINRIFNSVKDKIKHDNFCGDINDIQTYLGYIIDDLNNNIESIWLGVLWDNLLLWFNSSSNYFMYWTIESIDGFKQYYGINRLLEDGVTEFKIRPLTCISVFYALGDVHALIWANAIANNYYQLSGGMKI